LERAAAVLPPAQRRDELIGAEQIRSDERFPRGTGGPLQQVALFLQFGRGVPPEVIAIFGVGLTEAMEAERAELRGALGAAGAPDGRRGVEFAETGPALGRVLSRHTRLRRGA